MEWITEQLGIGAATQGKLLASIILLVLALVARGLIIRAVQRSVDDTEVVYRAGKLATYSATIVAGLTLAWIWLDSVTNLATYLAVVSAGLAIALTDVLKNVAGWGYIVIRRPLRVGDRIEIDGTKGDVLDIRLFRFTIAEVGNWVDAEQATGRLIHVPNGSLFAQQVANYTEGFEFVWHEVPVLITFESDWKAGRALLEEVAKRVAPDIEAKAGARIREAARNYHIKLGVLTPTVYVTVKDSGVLLTARMLVDVRDRRRIDQAVWTALLEGFDENPKLDLAYPTIRAYLREPTGG